MTAVRELADLTQRQAIIRPAAQRVRLSLLAGRTQVDTSLPVDVPLAILMPELVKLVHTREKSAADKADSSSPTEAKGRLWELREIGDPTPLSTAITLREAGVTDGELLRLTAQPTSSTPSLYDDVVDAAAQLNKTVHASWDASAARWMAFAGVHLASVVWVYLLVVHAVAPNREALIGMSIMVALALVGVATSAHRSHGQADIGAALGWAALPIIAGVAWVTMSRLGGYGLSAGSAALVLVCVAAFRAIGTGRVGFLAAGIFFSFTSIALAVYAIGVAGNVVAAGLAVIATLGCLAVPLLKSQSMHLGPPPNQLQDHESPTTSPVRRDSEPESSHAVKPLTSESVWMHIRSATLVRSGAYTGLASSATLGASGVLLSPLHAQWSGLTFVFMCAATLGLYAWRCVTTAELAALAIPAVALMMVGCVLAQQGNQPMPLVASIALLTATVMTATFGARSRPEQPRARSQTLIAYATYLSTATLIPLALWVAGVYDRLGIA